LPDVVVVPFAQPIELPFLDAFAAVESHSVLADLSPPLRVLHCCWLC
jgi:hypothetical protein